MVAPLDLTLGVTPLRGRELAAGWLPGIDADPVLLDEPIGAQPTPLAALDAVVARALACPPCGIAFSGGRDSSLVLAAAVRVARREGLDEPIALTRRFPDAPDAEEDGWQEQVVAHLGVTEWERIEVRTELDVVGPWAQRHLLAHGVVWPPMAHSNAPLLARLGAGCLLTGEGGDEVLGPHRVTPIVGTWRRRPRPSRVMVTSIGLAIAPALVRRAASRREHRDTAPWLRADVRRWLHASLAADEAKEPLRWPEALDYDARIRAPRLGHATLTALAAGAGVRLVDPLLDRGFQRALIAAGGRWGWVSRTDALCTLFAGLLPEPVLRRTSKARFHNVAVTEVSRAVASGWAGSGLPPDVADMIEPDALRRSWLSDVPDPGALGLLQAAWLGTAGADA